MAVTFACGSGQGDQTRPADRFRAFLDRMGAEGARAYDALVDRACQRLDPEAGGLTAMAATATMTAVACGSLAFRALQSTDPSRLSPTLLAIGATAATGAVAAMAGRAATETGLRHLMDKRGR